jgi:hypothetical protein
VAGEVLGNCEILDKLGEGGMGEVSRARDRRLPRLVALKILPQEVAGDAMWRARFEQEARALGALNHPNIVAIYDVGEDGGRAYIVSELVEGEPLRKAVELATQMADGKAAAHALGIVHRDLSCLDSGKVAGISDDGRVIAANVTGESGGGKGSVYLRKTDGSPVIRAGDGHAYGLSPTGPGEESDVRVPGLDVGVVYGWLDGARRYLVFGRLPGRKWRCFVWDAGRGTAQPLCPEGVADAFSYYVSPVEGGSAQEPHGIGKGEAVIGWRQDSRSVYVVPDGESTDSIPVSIVEIASGKRSAWKTIHPSRPVLGIHDLHVTPDGGAYAYNYVSAQSDLYVAHGLN